MVSGAKAPAGASPEVAGLGTRSVPLCKALGAYGCHAALDFSWDFWYHRKRCCHCRAVAVLSLAVALHPEVMSGEVVLGSVSGPLTV